MRGIWRENKVGEPVAVEVVDELLGGRLYRILVNDEALIVVNADTVEIVEEKAEVAA
jgi:hypothetical protein